VPSTVVLVTIDPDDSAVASKVDEPMASGTVVLTNPCETVVLLDEAVEVDEVETTGTVTLKERVPNVRVCV
jgi:hypothetical protein